MAMLLFFCLQLGHKLQGKQQQHHYSLGQTHRIAIGSAATDEGVLEQYDLV